MKRLDATVNAPPQPLQDAVLVHAAIIADPASSNGRKLAAIHELNGRFVAAGSIDSAAAIVGLLPPEALSAALDLVRQPPSSLTPLRLT